MTLQLATGLEVDVTGVTVQKAPFYQALLGCDLLMGKAGVLGPATINLGVDTSTGSVHWPQLRAHSILVSPFLEKTASANPAYGALPPPPSKAGAKSPAPASVSLTTIRLADTHRTALQALAKERDA